MQGSVSGRRAVLSIWFYQGQKSSAAAQTRFLSLTLPVQQSLRWQDASFPLQQWLHRPEKLFNLFGTTNLQRQGTLRTFLSFVILFHVFLFPSLIFSWTISRTKWWAQEMILGKSSYRKAYWNDVSKLFSDWILSLHFQAYRAQVHLQVSMIVPEKLLRKGPKHLQRRDYFSQIKNSLIFSSASSTSVN